MSQFINSCSFYITLLKLKLLFTTSDNQFGFRPLCGTDMCTFLLKEVVRSYNLKKTPVCSVFLDAVKAFHQVNHTIAYYSAVPYGSICMIRTLVSFTLTSLLVYYPNYPDQMG